MTFWLKTPNNIYKNCLNSQIVRIMFTVSKLEIKNVAIQVEHPDNMIFDFTISVSADSFSTDTTLS